MLYLILILKWTQSDMNLALLFHSRRGAGRVVQWAMPPPHFLADQLSLFQPGWANYAHQINAAPLQIFGPSAASGAGLGQKRKRQLAAYLAKNIQITIIRTHWKVRVCAKLQK